MQMNEFERDHKIDPNQLDVEATQQPELFFKWAEQAAKARGRMDHSKFQLEIIEASLYLQAVKDPDSFDLPKTTEGALKAAIKTHHEYIAASGRYHSAREESVMLDKAVGAMEMKKRMIESLITLHGQSYFAGPATPRNLGEAWLNQKKQAEEQFEKKLRKKVRKRRKKA